MPDMNRYVICIVWYNSSNGGIFLPSWVGSLFLLDETESCHYLPTHILL